MKMFYILFLPVLLFSQIPDAQEIWSEPVEISIINQTFPQDLKTPYINTQGDMLYFEVNGEIYYSQKSDTGWGLPAIVSSHLNDVYTSFPRISRDNLRLYFLMDSSPDKGLYYLERDYLDSAWGNRTKVSSVINNDSLCIEDFYFPNDTTLLITDYFTTYQTIFNAGLNDWGEIEYLSQLSGNFFLYNRGGVYLNSTCSKLYTTALNKVWWWEGEQYHELSKRFLIIKYKDQNGFWNDDFKLNLEAEIDSLYNMDWNYYVSSPSLTENEKTLFYVIDYVDTTTLGFLSKIYFSTLLVDEKGNKVGLQDLDGWGKNNSPDDYVLLRNFPNPFNPQTTIQISLSQNMKVSECSFDIYNVLGQRVRTFVPDQTSDLHSHELIWDGTNDFGKSVTSGTYIFVLNSPDMTKVLKMLMMK